MTCFSELPCRSEAKEKMECRRRTHPGDGGRYQVTIEPQERKVTLNTCMEDGELFVIFYFIFYFIFKEVDAWGLFTSVSACCPKALLLLRLLGEMVCTNQWRTIGTPAKQPHHQIAQVVIHLAPSTQRTN